MDWSKLKFRDRWGQLAIYDDQWQMLSLVQLFEIANELMTLCDLVKDAGSQETVVENAWIDYLRRAISSSDWYFDPSKKQLKPHQGCIYFLRDPQNPSVTKVGFSTEISQRVRALSGIVTKYDHKLDLVAVAYTEQPKRLEEATHRYLAKYHTKGEWFLSDGVDALLKEVKELLDRKGS